MRKLLIVALSCLCIATGVNAQKKISKDSLLTKIADETCTELKKIDASKMSSEDLQMQLGIAMLPAFSKYSTELMDVYGTDDISSLMEQIGEDVGYKLVAVCPAFLKLFASNPSLMNDDAGDEKKLKLTGTLVKIVPGDLTYFEIKDAGGKINKIWWLEYFEDADVIALKSSISKKFTISYVEKEVYNAALNTYIKIKIAKGAKL